MLLFFIVINEIKSWYQNGIKSMYASHKMLNFLQEEPHIAQFLTHELCMSLIYVTLFYSSVDLTVVTSVFCVIGWTSDWIINKSNPFTWIRNWRLLNTFKMYEVHSYCLRYNFRDAYLCPEVVVGGHILIIQVTKRVELSLKKI